MYPYIYLPHTTVAVQSYIVCLILAVAAALLLGYGSAVEVERLDPGATRKSLAVIAMGALLGGHVHFVVANIAAVRAAPFNVVVSPSLHAPGAVIGALFGLIATRRYVSPLRLADALAPGAGIGIAIARLGCFLNGCCFGDLCPHFWGLRFPLQHVSYLLQVDKGLLPTEATAPLPIHPLQLYFAGTGLLIAAVLYWLRPHKRYDGQLGLLFLVQFFATSAMWEPFRADTADRVYIGPFPQLLWITAAMTAVAATLLALAELRSLNQGMRTRHDRTPATHREWQRRAP